MAADPADRISQFILTQCKLAPTRKLFSLARKTGIGEETVTEVGVTNAKFVVETIKAAMIADLQSVGGRVTYIIRAMSEAREALGQVNTVAQGSQDSDIASSGGINPALTRLVDQAFSQTLTNHAQTVADYREICLGLRGDVADRDLKIEDLQLTIKALQEKMTELVIAVSQTDQPASPAEIAKADLYKQMAKNVGEVPGMVKAIFGKYDQSKRLELPPSTESILAVRKAAASLSDASIARAIRLLASKHQGAAAATMGCFSPDEIAVLRAAIAPLLGGEPDKGDSPPVANGSN